MRMQVSEHGEELLIELFGVAGRHQRILQALTEGPFPFGSRRGLGEARRGTADISVRAGADEMRIRLRVRAGDILEAQAIYRYLRHELVELDGTRARDGEDEIRSAGEAVAI
jgi:hypothetical protein